MGRTVGPIAEGEERRVLGGEVMPVPAACEWMCWGDWPKSFLTGAVALRLIGLTGGGGERQLDRFEGPGDGRLGAGEPARADIFAGAGDPARAERLAGAGEGRLGAGEPARAGGGGERREERLGAGEGRRGGAGERFRIGGGGERRELLRRGVNEVLLSGA